MLTASTFVHPSWISCFLQLAGHQASNRCQLFHIPDTKKLIFFSPDTSCLYSSQDYYCSWQIWKEWGCLNGATMKLYLLLFEFWFLNATDTPPTPPPNTHPTPPPPHTHTHTSLTHKLNEFYFNYKQTNFKKQQLSLTVFAFVMITLVIFLHSIAAWLCLTSKLQATYELQVV